MTLAPVAPELVRWQAEGIPVICLEEGYARGNFPELKTLNALATLSALRRAAAAGCPEALLTGPHGQLLEGAVSNIFLVAGDHLVTPASEGGFLAGRTRERILKIASREKLDVRKEVIDRRQLNAAREVFVVSSVREVLPVVRIDGQAVGEGIPGPVTRLIQDKYRALIARDLREQ
jgi:branched-chain amino acid aminotransferase